MIKLRPRSLILIGAVLTCAASIILVLTKGNPENRASFDSVAEIGEGLLSILGKTKNVLLPISDEEEMRIGDRIHEKAIKEQFSNKPADPVLEKYINEVGSKVVLNIKRPGIQYKFHLLDLYTPAAFSSAGGHIYITTGLLKVLKSEAELAGVIAHEVTHVDAKHCIGAIQILARNTDSSGSRSDRIVETGIDLLLAPGYSEDRESEADAGGVYLASRAGYHPMAIIRAFERINKEELSNSGSGRPLTPAGDTLDAAGGLIARYFKTHPPTAERINKINKYIVDNDLMGANKLFYIGQINFNKKISMRSKRYKEEFAKDYSVV